MRVKLYYTLIITMQQYRDDSLAKIKKITDNTVDHPQFFIGDSQVENVDRTRYLGVIIDRSLTWEQHVKNLHPKVCRAIGFLKYSRKF